MRILGSYNGRCCISHVKDPRLLEACHIKNWADNEELRTDPSNGLCLNVLLHKAYDNFLISISPDYIISISDAFLDGLNDDIQRAYYLGKDGQQIVKPTRFFPYRECLEMHYNKYRNTI